MYCHSRRIQKKEEQRNKRKKGRKRTKESRKGSRKAETKAHLLPVFDYSNRENCRVFHKFVLHFCFRFLILFLLSLFFHFLSLSFLFFTLFAFASLISCRFSVFCFLRVFHPVCLCSASPCLYVIFFGFSDNGCRG